MIVYRILWLVKNLILMTLVPRNLALSVLNSNESYAFHIF